VRVLFITHNIPRFAGDAAGSFVLRLAVALQQSGAHVDVIAPGGEGLPSVGRLEHVAIHRVRYGPDHAMTLAYGGTMAESVRASWGGKVALLRLLRALRQAARVQLATAVRAGEPYDVVHAHWWFPAGLSLWRALTPSDPPLVITMHGSDVRLAQGIAPARRMMRAVLAMAVVRTAVSSWLADRASHIAPGMRIHVEPMPVDTDSFIPPTSESPRSGILFVGRLNAQKGLATLLEAMALPALHGARLDVVGDGPDAQSLRARASALGLLDRVQWHGALPQQALVPRYQGAVVLALPSTEEGLGLVAVEAQLCETPVVAFASGGVPDVVRVDAGGTLVTPGDTASFAHALARVLADPVIARRDGQRARQAMLTHFSPDAVAQRYLAHYRSAIAREPVAG
jgi:glycosyltransferase involved in cell wall biosynthesis